MKQRRTRSEISRMSDTAATALAGQVALPKVVSMAAPVRRILTIHPGTLADFIYTLPALHALRESYPAARICAFVPEIMCELMAESADVDELLSRAGQGVSGQLSLWMKLREKQFDMAVTFAASRKATLMAVASGAGTRAGFAGARWGQLLTISQDRAAHSDVAAHLQLVRSLGCRISQGDYRHLLGPSLEHLQKADQLLAQRQVERSFVLLCPTYKNKTLPVQTQAELASKTSIVVVKSTFANPQKVPTLYDFTDCASVGMWGALCSRAQAVISADAGLLHLAACLGRPVIGLEETARSRANLPCGGASQIISEEASAKVLLKALAEVAAEAGRE